MTNAGTLCHWDDLQFELKLKEPGNNSIPIDCGHIYLLPVRQLVLLSQIAPVNPRAGPTVPCHTKSRFLSVTSIAHLKTNNSVLADQYEPISCNCQHQKQILAKLPWKKKNLASILAISTASGFAKIKKYLRRNKNSNLAHRPTTLLAKGDSSFTHFFVPEGVRSIAFGFSWLTGFAPKYSITEFISHCIILHMPLLPKISVRKWQTVKVHYEVILYNLHERIHRFNSIHFTYYSNRLHETFPRISN